MAVGRDTNDTSADTLAQEQHTKEEEERKEEAADRQAGPPEKPSSWFINHILSQADSLKEFNLDDSSSERGNKVISKIPDAVRNTSLYACAHEHTYLCQDRKM